MCAELGLRLVEQRRTPLLVRRTPQMNWVCGRSRSPLWRSHCALAPGSDSQRTRVSRIPIRVRSEYLPSVSAHHRTGRLSPFRKRLYNWTRAPVYVDCHSLLVKTSCAPALHPSPAFRNGATPRDFAGGNPEPHLRGRADCRLRGLRPAPRPMDQYAPGRSPRDTAHGGQRRDR